MWPYFSNFDRLLNYFNPLPYLKEEGTDIVVELRKWLGPNGLKHFRDIKAKYGKINAVWHEGGIPHCVHFREGMSIRNKLRELTNYSWTDHEYDDRWVEYVEKAIEC